MTREEEDTNVNLGRLGYGRSTVIRSHRRPPTHSSKRKTGVVLAIVITATLVSASTLETEQPTPTNITAVGLADVPTIELPQEAAEERAIKADTPSRSAGRTAKPVTSKIEIVITFALAQQGDRYVWAKSGPDSYDCSGLVLRAFAQAGITLPHYTGTMINKGVKVSRANLMRGDIIFPTSGHVGIYLGGNQMVHASSSKGQVVVAKVYSFYAGRRML